jgi:DNA-binding SARP family transcriptional activator/streptogramin lyase
VPRDDLADLLWGEAPPPTWDKALTVLASKLRSLLADTGVDGASALTAAFGCYRLELPQGTWVDVVAATGAVHEAEDALAAGDVDKAEAAAALAASLLQHPMLAGEDGSWLEEKRRELTDVRIRALTVLADACLRSGETSEAARWAEQVTALEPFRETGYRLLMEAHVAAGNRAEALRVYERCRRLLAEELGAYPSPETESTYRRLLRGESDAGGAAAQAVEPPPPETRVGRHGVRRRTALVAGALLVAGAVSAALAVGSHGSPSPRVLPNSVVRIDPATAKVKQVVPVGSSPDLVVAAGGYVWVTSHILRPAFGGLRNGGDRTLSRVDPSTGRAVVVGGGLAPCGLTADPSGDIWVANCYPASGGPGDDVVRVDARTLDFEKTWRVPGGDGYYRGLTYGGGSLWVSQIFGGYDPNANVVTQVDPQTGARRSIRLDRAAAGLAWSNGYDDLWVGNVDDGSLTQFRPGTGTVATVERVANLPAFPVVDGGVVWVGDLLGPQVVRLDAVGPPRMHTVSLPVGDPGAGVLNIASGAGAIWATTPQAGALWRIDPKTDAVTRVNVPYAPVGVAADALDVWVTVRRRF